jgi:hypothetical protein
MLKCIPQSDDEFYLKQCCWTFIFLYNSSDIVAPPLAIGDNDIPVK